MSNKRLATLGLDDSLLMRLTKNHLVTCKDVLSTTDLELVHLLNVSIYVVKNLTSRVCEACAPVPTTAFDIWEARKRKESLNFIPTSLKELDMLLKGGVPAGSITEIAGPSGCGKTQFCLMMCIMSMLSMGDDNVSGGVIYIDTESTFSPQRLVEMAVHRFPDIFFSAESQYALLSRVLVCSELHCSSLLSRLQTLEEEVVTRGARLVVLDSVASLVRKEFDAGVRHNLAERSKWLTKIAAVLKQTAECLSIPVVVTNQITTHIHHQAQFVEMQNDNDDLANERNLTHDGACVTVALGNTWSHCVNTRLIVQYLGNNRRQILVAKSPAAPFTSFVYSIDASGLVLEEGGTNHYQGTDPGLQSIRVRSSMKSEAFAFE